MRGIRQRTLNMNTRPSGRAVQGFGGMAWEQRELEKWRESEGNETKKVQSQEMK